MLSSVRLAALHLPISPTRDTQEPSSLSDTQLLCAFDCAPKTAYTAVIYTERRSHAEAAALAYQKVWAIYRV